MKRNRDIAGKILTGAIALVAISVTLWDNFCGWHLGDSQLPEAST
jgi:hypothetical protein